MNPQELDKRIRDDFKIFLQLVWSELNLPKPTRAQYAIADYLQHGPKRLQIQAFRGVGKSYITSAYVLWELYKDPNKKIICISASKERADNTSIFMQRLITDVRWLSHLQPEPDARWSRVSFDVGGCVPTQAPSVKSVGITGNMTGSRADIMLFDDVEVPNNSATDMQREKLLQLCSEAESILIPKEESRILYLGTPQTVFTVYRKLAERNYKPFVWTSRYPRELAGYADDLAPQLVSDLEKDPDLAWQPTDTRFREVDLLQREASMGRSNYMLQFQLDTTLSDAEKFPLKFADLVVTPLGNEVSEKYTWSSDPRFMVTTLNPVGLPGDRFYAPMAIAPGVVDYAETIVSVDPSGRGTDETVACVLSQSNGYIFLREMRAYRDGYSDDTLSDIVRLGKMHKATSLLIESNFGDGMVAELFKKHLMQQQAGMTVEETRATVRKEERILDTLEPIFNQHKLVVDPKVFEWDYASNPKEAPEKRLGYMLMTQISRLCREKGAIRHDDRVDALAQGVQYFLDAMSISADKEIARRAYEEWSAREQAFVDNPRLATDFLVLGKSFRDIPKSPKVYNW